MVNWTMTEFSGLQSLMSWVNAQPSTTTIQIVWLGGLSFYAYYHT
ncbi:MAG: hypothetical protein ABSF63_12890 [Candidatus Bathyarchaeia archaeon]